MDPCESHTESNRLNSVKSSAIVGVDIGSTKRDKVTGPRECGKEGVEESVSFTNGEGWGSSSTHFEERNVHEIVYILGETFFFLSSLSVRVYVYEFIRPMKSHRSRASAF